MTFASIALRILAFYPTSKKQFYNISSIFRAKRPPVTTWSQNLFSGSWILNMLNYFILWISLYLFVCSFVLLCSVFVKWFLEIFDHEKLKLQFLFFSPWNFMNPWQCPAQWSIDHWRTNLLPVFFCQ